MKRRLAANAYGRQLCCHWQDLIIGRGNQPDVGRSALCQIACRRTGAYKFNRLSGVLRLAAQHCLDLQQAGSLPQMRQGLRGTAGTNDVKRQHAAAKRCCCCSDSRISIGSSALRAASSMFQATLSTLIGR